MYLANVSMLRGTLCLCWRSLLIPSILQWNKCPERFIDQGGLDRLALLLDTASGTDQAIPVATSILAALQVLCQQQELVEPHQAQIDDIKAQAHIFVDPT
eukprot:TRINITY_DN11251_c0_g2_i2.p4 TRINITY_DN11251_c0_g2~~TRINITY_DN11251_c0_g2_i2.p4  ORF type:complete len:100 (+),score=16.78 TRINITY_DN11251_c0_g2_i2:1767-2066(+)